MILATFMFNIYLCSTSLFILHLLSDWNFLNAIYSQVFTKGLNKTGVKCASFWQGQKVLLSYVRDGDKVLVYSVDCLGRDTIDVLTTVEELKEKGVAIIPMREGFGLSTDHGKLMLTMLVSLTELVKKNIKAR